MRCVVDPSSIHKYDWAEYLLDKLMEAAQKVRDMMKKDEKAISVMHRYDEKGW